MKIAIIILIPIVLSLEIIFTIGTIGLYLFTDNDLLTKKLIDKL